MTSGPAFVSFCGNPKCPCARPRATVCGEYKPTRQGRCGECGNPEDVHRPSPATQPVPLITTRATARSSE